jgi:mRNA interferase MazF
LIFQNDELNKSDYATTIIIPFTTSLIDEAEPLRYRIRKRDRLGKDSDLLVAHIRSIDNNRLIQKIAALSSNEMTIIKKLLDEVLLDL